MFSDYYIHIILFIQPVSFLEKTRLIHIFHLLFFVYIFRPDRIENHVKVLFKEM